MHRRMLMAGATIAAGCTGSQSTLDPAGRGAQQIHALMASAGLGALVIWLALLGSAWYALRFVPDRHTERVARRFIVVGGVVIPVLLLTGLLAYSLSMTPALLAPGHDLEIDVVGEQFWWRVRYRLPDGRTFETANELQLPVDHRIELRLTTTDVIHSFWVPSLAGKIDMLPGRENRLLLEPTRTGTFRGVCAEFCGASHALMAFDVEVLPAAEFERWTAAQQAASVAPTTRLAQAGQRAFLTNGCGACHRIAGTRADGRIGPDLTHFSSRRSLGAGTLPMSRQAVRHWLARPGAIKPGVAMPGYDALDDSVLEAIAAYLEQLE